MSATNRRLSAGLLWAALAWPAAALSVPPSAIVSVSDGAPFALIRGTVVYSAGRATLVSPGDLIESGPGSLLIVEFTTGGVVGATVAIGPSTQAYWMSRRDVPTLAVLRGWIKVDTLASGHPAQFQTLGLRLGATTTAGVYVIHVGDDSDEVFHEAGSVALLVQKPGGESSEASKPSQFSSRSGSGPIQTSTGPGAAFGTGLPAAFRDPLPVGMSAKLHGTAEPQVVREVTYDDIAAWLGAPGDWRRGFVERFRPRLKDPGFFRALDAHIGVHSEWYPVLHPPPRPPETPPGSGVH